MKKTILTERFQQLAGLKPLYTLKENNLDSLNPSADPFVKLNNFFTNNTFIDDETERTNADEISLRDIDINTDTFEMTVNGEVFALNHDLTFLLVQEFPDGFYKYKRQHLPNTQAK